LGDIAVGGNIRIPFILMKPNGDAVESATLRSEGIYRYDPETYNKQYIKFDSDITTDLSGTTIGEIVINNTNSGYDFTSAQYLFDISGNISSVPFSLEEWKWPRGNLKAFLTTDQMGKYGGWIRDFKPITTTIFGDQKGQSAIQLRSVNLSCCGYNSDGYFNGVADNAFNNNDSDCTNYNPPPDAESTSAEQIHQAQVWQFSDPKYYFYFSGNDSEQKVWVKAGDCDFSESQAYAAGDYINITQRRNTYMLQILAINVSDQSYRNSYALIGVNISDTQYARPLQINNNDGSGNWKLIALNLSGRIANALLVNGTNSNPMCDIWTGECISGAFISTDGDYNGFNQENLLSVGSQILEFDDFYISGLGPNSWQAISISNGSSFSESIQKPVFGNLFTADNTPLYVKFVNETSNNTDYNLDGDLNDTFYIIAYDDLQDGLQVVNRIVIDDDNEITPQWQSQSQPTDYYDYFGSEQGITEQWGGLPSAIWSGNLMFGPEQEDDSYRNLPWEQKAAWNVILFNNYDMLINKDAWCGINENDSLKLIIRTYGFNQSNVEGANISVSKIYKYGFMGGGLYSPSDYTASSALTDSTGYGIITISPNPSWDTDNGRGSDYIFKIAVKDSMNNTATIDRYVQIGSECEWNKK
jgi:hypothetical protein